MKSSELRRRFLEFFRKRDHAILPSDSLIPAKDPTLLFTGAGMNPFKDYFLGVKKDLKRAATCQKCFRTGDVEQVGRTPAHLTFFEMLGNFSFGDYFKKEAVGFAWEFLTEDLRLPADRLWASVYEKDDEAAGIWEKQIGLPADRIVRFGAKDNFWPSNAPTQGPNGPCGPCSEIYYDYNRCLVGKTCPDPDHCKPGCPCGRFVEIWNLVFTQFDRRPDGRLADLPAKNIDTGMGLERLAAVTQDKMGVFETDLFEPIIEELILLQRAQAPEGFRKDQRGFVYAIADHARALTFLVGDGAVASNEGRGYVLRMLLRKAARAGATLGLKKPFLYQLVPQVVKIMGTAYPELVSRRESIAKAILTEEERFQQTLTEKLPLLEDALRLESTGRPNESRVVFDIEHLAQLAARFYDTHGLSYEEIAEICGKHGIAPPPREAFDKALEALQAKSRAASRFAGEIFAQDALQELVLKTASETKFVGYEQMTSRAKVLGLVRENRLVPSAQAPAPIGVILDVSPFYGEAGGQVGDAGTLEGPEGKLTVTDTQWVGHVLVHSAQLKEGRIQVGDPVTGRVDEKRRRCVAQNHTATHLLHSALRKVLGDHVSQAGSLVAPDHLRLDFSHGQGLSRGQLDSVESLVNEWVETNLPVTVDSMSLDEAQRSGALAFFGDKYGAMVRVVAIGEVSKELCGGTHLKASGEVGLLTIVEEGSIASGVRRVEALSDQAALDSLGAEVARLKQDQERLMKRKKQLEEEKVSLKSRKSVA